MTPAYNNVPAANFSVDYRCDALALLFSSRHNCDWKRVGYKLPDSVAYFPTFREFFDIQVEVSRRISPRALLRPVWRKDGRFAGLRALLLTALHSALRWLSYPTAAHCLLNFNPGRHFVR